ncbi:hypothetical protein OPV22_024925 [Ensete ventricosum]|uniref:Secreted protein n=1 Tax=Ensete ventricosum TaxID=4639 RepID=A0AAV8QG82_ENSVE|nr:hypothetical protein OPV22_024925 [Ensete ventricosum]
MACDGAVSVACSLLFLSAFCCSFLFLATPGDAIPFPFRAYPSPISSRELHLDPCFASLCCRSYLICLSARRISPGEERAMRDVEEA